MEGGGGVLGHVLHRPPEGPQRAGSASAHGFADEPTTALDVVARAEILGLLSSLTSLPQAPALLLITHDLPAAAICENIAVLHDGAIIESGQTRSVLTRPEHPVTAAMCEAGAEETIDGALAAAGAAA